MSGIADADVRTIRVVNSCGIVVSKCNPDICCNVEADKYPVEIAMYIPVGRVIEGRDFPTVVGNPNCGEGLLSMPYLFGKVFPCKVTLLVERFKRKFGELVILIGGDPNGIAVSVRIPVSRLVGKLDFVQHNYLHNYLGKIIRDTRYRQSTL